jgi:hypothetical protein
MKIKATVEGIQFEWDSTALSRSERKEMISSFILPLCEERLASADRVQRERLIEGMALEPDLRFEVGQRVANSLPPENPDSADWAVKLLVASDLMEAITPLTELLEYQASTDHATCCGDHVHDLALSALRSLSRIIANSDTRPHAWRLHACRSNREPSTGI